MQITGKRVTHFFAHHLSRSGARSGLAAAGRAMRRRLIAPPAKRLLVGATVLYRRVVLHRVTFIGVTGSCGKTTTKELIDAILTSTLKGHKNRGGQNLPKHIVKTVWG